MEDNVTKLRKARKTNQKRDWTWPSFVEAWQSSESYEGREAEEAAAQAQKLEHRLAGTCQPCKRKE